MVSPAELSRPGRSLTFNSDSIEKVKSRRVDELVETILALGTQRYVPIQTC